MKYTGFFFEANSIQAYILQGGRLRDIVGASYLLDQLCTTDIEAACKQIQLEEVRHAPDGARQILFTRKASGAIYAVLGSVEAARELAALWSLWVRQRCPGLSFNQALSSGANVFQVIGEGSKALGQVRSMPAPGLPTAAPMVERSPRTGLSASQQSHVLGQQELVDSAVAARRRVIEQAQRDNRNKLNPQPVDGLRYVFPVNLEFDPEGDADEYGFPFEQQSRSVGILHADANGLGQVLLKIIATAEKDPQTAGKHFPEFLARLSACVADATVAAGRRAVESVLVHSAAHVSGKPVRVLPARPILLAGDDLTIILRADVALPFLDTFSAAFEQETRASFATLRKEDFARPFKGQLPTALTMCAGLQFVRNNFPFSQALHLAEDLCSAAKKQAKDLQKRHELNLTPAAVCFHRMTTSLADEDGAQALPGLGAYGLQSDSKEHAKAGLPSLQGLMELARALSASEQTGAGPMRRLLNAATTDPAEALSDYRRWRQLSEKSTPQTLRDFDQLIGRVHRDINPTAFPGLQGKEGETGHDRWVLPDLMHILSTQGEASKPSPTKD
jgi:hypothetical protein